ncbi:MAG: hypothetical protein HYZ83_01965 [Candidatus Omnitrophica bacterium]|nr:hypothetical protein [Candidatus Omnitrophota bacterium]
MSFAVGSALFDPAGGNIDGGCRDGVVAFERIATMHEGIGFQEAGTFFIPLIGFDRDVMFKQETWFGGGPAFTAVEMFDGAKDAVDGGRRDLGEFFKDLKSQRPEFLVVGREPDGEDGFKTF